MTIADTTTLVSELLDLFKKVTDPTRTYAQSAEEFAAVLQNYVDDIVDGDVNASAKNCGDESLEASTVEAQIQSLLCSVGDLGGGGGGSVLSHTDLQDIGINTHAQIDSHIADTTVHFTEGSIDHGNISGLSDDDHSGHPWLNGRSGGQVLFGSPDAAEILSLSGTSNASKGYVRIGTSGVSSRGIAGDGALLINDETEINGKLWVDGQANFAASFDAQTNAWFRMGTGGLTRLGWASVETPDSLKWTFHSTNKNLIIADWVNRNNDHGVGTPVKNTIWIFDSTDVSLDDTHWLSLAFGEIATGNGDLTLDPVTGTVRIVGDFVPDSPLIEFIEVSTLRSEIGHDTINNQLNIESHEGSIFLHSQDDEVIINGESGATALIINGVNNTHDVVWRYDTSDDFARARLNSDQGFFVFETLGTGYDLNLAAATGTVRIVNSIDSILIWAEGTLGGVVDERAAISYDVTANEFIITSLESGSDIVLLPDNLINVPDNIPLAFGDSNDSGFLWSTVQTNDALLLVTGSSNTVIIADSSSADFGRAAETDPTLVIQSADQLSPSQWIALQHDQTDGIIDVGSGNLEIRIQGTRRLEIGANFAYFDSDSGDFTLSIDSSLTDDAILRFREGNADRINIYHDGGVNDFILDSVKPGVNIIFRPNDQCLFSDGSESSPIIAFENDTNNGIYREAADVWHLVQNSSSMISLRSSGVGVNDNTIEDLGYPNEKTDAANKEYVDWEWGAWARATAWVGSVALRTTGIMGNTLTTGDGSETKNALNDVDGIWVELITGATSGNWAAFAQTSSAAEWLRFNSKPCKASFRIKTPSTISSARFWLAFIEDSLSNVNTATVDDPTAALSTADYIGFRYSSTVLSGNWGVVIGPGSAPSTVLDTGISVAASTTYLLTFEWNGTNTLTVWVNGVKTNTRVSTSVPGEDMRLLVSVATKTTASRRLPFGHMKARVRYDA